MGMHGERVETAEDVPGAIERAMAHPGPALVDVTTDPNARAMPPKKTFAEVKGFALAMTRMVFEGDGDNAVELVKENVRTIV